MPDDVEQTNSRDDVAAAFDAVAAPEAAQNAAPEPISAPESATAAPVEAETPTEPHGRARDEHGRFKKTDEKPVAAPNGTPPARVSDSGAQGALAQPPGAVPSLTAQAGPPASVLKAPSSLKPAAREAWAKAPRELQEDIVRIDREVRRTMEESAKARETSETFQQIAGPYEGMLRAEGVTPMQAFDGLMRLSYALRAGTPDQKAHLLATHIKTFLGTDERAITLLAQHLDGQPAARSPGQQQMDPAAIIAQARQAFADELRTHQSTYEQQQAQSVVDDFAQTADFWEDVKDDVADLLELKANRNIPMSIEEAYDQVCRLNPEISKILDQREASKQAATGAPATQRARAAASSVKSQPGGPTTAQPGDDWRSHVSAAWDAASGR